MSFNNPNMSYGGNDGAVRFSINGNIRAVNPDRDINVGPQSVLVDYIRDNAGLKGTKYLCREGGCGACLVSVIAKNPLTGEEKSKSVPSCIIPTLSCHGWSITTVEDLGNKKEGYNPIQKRLEKFCGTQCGFCTPGMVMNMYSLVNGQESVSVKDVEDIFDGNICRCTGYRSIMDAFKSLTIDAPQELLQKCSDIEDMCKASCITDKTDCKCCLGRGKRQPTPIRTSKATLLMNFPSGEKWVKVSSLTTLFGALNDIKSGNIKYRLVTGNTGVGIFKNDGPYQTYVDITHVPELLQSTVDSSGMVLGGGISISDAIRIFKKASVESGYKYAEVVSKHFTQRLGNHHIRNLATVAGNLMLKHAHPEFASDIFMIFEALSAKIVVATAPGVRLLYHMNEFLESNMDGKVIIAINLPPLTSDYFLKTYKVSPRYQNSRGYINAAFLFKLDISNNFNILEKPQLVFGGVNLNHAIKTEEILIGKSLNDEKTLQLALKSLSSEIAPNHAPPNATPEYRKYLAQALFYKAILGILGGKANANIQSGGLSIKHNVSSGKQNYEKDGNSQVLYQGMPKLETMQQCSGEAEYVNDIHPQQGELFGAFVLSNVANANLKSVDASKALKIPGVYKFVSAKDIPGHNNYMIWEPQAEEIFVSEKVHHAGQPIGIILAETREKAFAGAKNVAVTYENIQKPVLTIKDALSKAEKDKNYDKLILKVFKSQEISNEKPAHVLKGEMKIGGQYHFQMEPHVCICIPKEDSSMDIFCATQWVDRLQAVVSSVLNYPANNINVQVRRLGGGFGGKITRSAHVAAACAIGSYVTNKPVRIALDLETSMRMIGKRLPYLAKYEVGISTSGKIVSLGLKVFCDPGFSPNEATTMYFMMTIQNCYNALGWEVTTGRVLTNTPANTYCRAPGHPQGVAVIENVMEHIAHFLKIEPWEVRQVNMIQKGNSILFNPSTKLQDENPLEKMLLDLKSSAEYSTRLDFIKTFNQENKWIKRGMALVPMRFPNHYIGGKYSVYIAIYYIDGTIAISHGGIEMGQGINTKIAQTVAEILNVPLSNIKVKPTNNLVSANSSLTAAGTTSESCCFAAAAASKILLDRMAPVRERMDNSSWMDIVKECSKENIDLTASYMNSPKDTMEPYDVWGLNLTEVEVDVITGEYNVLRIDFVIDGGKSLNPEVDIGQIEGSLVMGLGLWTTEKLVYDENTGQLLTSRAWDYKPPETKDVPQDFRITLLNDVPNRYGVLSSKGAGEPPICTSVCVIFALKNAIDSYRRESGNCEWYQIDGPITPEDVYRYTLVSTSHFNL